MESYYLDKYKKYELQNLKQFFSDTNEYSIISLVSFYDGTLVKISIETYDKNMNLLDSLFCIVKSSKKRTEKTLSKIGITEKDILEGMEEKECSKLISNYFIQHTGVILSIKTDKKINLLNKFLAKYSWKLIECISIDMDVMLKKFNVDIDSNDSINNLKDDLKLSFRQLNKVLSIESNKRACVVKYAYYWENKRRINQKWLMCNTSIGVIYYDTLFNRWDMTQKERKTTGLIIEHFDTLDIENQLMKKYRKKTLSDVIAALQKTSKSSMDLS